MDSLEHWHFSDNFSAREAAALAAGIDPHDGAMVNTESAPSAYKVILEKMLRSLGETYNFMSYLLTTGSFGGGKPRDIQEWIEVVLGPSYLVSLELRDFLSLVRSKNREANFAEEDWFKQRLIAAGGAKDPRFGRADLARWFKHHGGPDFSKYSFERAAPRDQKPTEKSAEPPAPELGSRERNTLLGIIAVIAVKKYGFDPDPDARLDMLGRLRTDCETAGIEISDDTLRAKLKEAFKLLPNQTS